MVLGQEKILAFFQQAQAGNSLAQVYILVGSAQVGKRTAARQIATQLLKISEQQLDSHPDFRMLERQIDEKTGKLRKDLGVAQARALREELTRCAWLGGYRVVIIDEAERLNEEAGNALLKILEEPPEHSIIFLLTENEAALLPTIRSRAQIIYCSMSSEKIIQQFLVEQGCPAKEAAAIARLAWGRPGRALRLFQDSAFRDACQRAIEQWHELEQQPFHLQIKILDNFFSRLENSSRNRDELMEILELWRMEERQAIIASPEKRRVETIDRLGRAVQLIQQNIHPRLVVENILLHS